MRIAALLIALSAGGFVFGFSAKMSMEAGAEDCHARAEALQRAPQANPPLAGYLPMPEFETRYPPMCEAWPTATDCFNLIVGSAIAAILAYAASLLVGKFFRWASR